MRRKPKKLHLRVGVFVLTCIFLLLAVYIPLLFYSTESMHKSFRRAYKDKLHRSRKSTRPENQKLNQPEIKGWEVNVSRNTHHYVFPDNVTTIINIKNLSSDLFLLVVVCSAPANFEHRSAIRDTWASLTDNSTRVTFLLGEPDNATLQAMIVEESEMYNDVIQEMFVDSYKNLTIKSVMMLKWMLQHSARFFMKSNDDIYLNLPALSEALQPVAKRKNILVGFLNCKSKPIQNPKHKWYIPRYIFNEHYFPDYLSGSGYVMSQDIILKIYQAALITPIIPLEDVYITGICARAVRVKPLYLYGFFGVRRNLTDSCDPMILTNHNLDPQNLRIAFSYINNCSMYTRQPRAKRHPAFITKCRYS